MEPLSPFRQAMLDCMLGIYTAVIHVLAIFGAFGIYMYYYTPGELCKSALKHMLLPFGWK